MGSSMPRHACVSHIASAILLLHLREGERVCFHQHTSPAALTLKEKRVRIFFTVKSSYFYEAKATCSTKQLVDVPDKRSILEMVTRHISVSLYNFQLCKWRAVPTLCILVHVLAVLSPRQ